MSYRQEYNFYEQNYSEPTDKTRQIFSVRGRRDIGDVTETDERNNAEWSNFNQRVLDNPELNDIFEAAKKEGELEALKTMHTRLRNLGIGTEDVEKQMRKTVMKNVLKGNDIEANIK